MPGRRHDLDWLRVIAFAILIFYHLGMFYVSWGWHVKSSHASPAIEPLMALVNPWRLPLLFFISGVALRFAMDSRPLGGLARERLGRLFVPLAFGMAVIVAPQAYFELLSKGEIGPDPLAFYLRYLSFDQSFSIIVPTWNHLWYVAYMLAYTLLLIALAPLLRAAEARWAETAAWFLGANWRLLLVVPLPFFAYALLLDPRFPTTHALVDDPAAHAHSFTMVLIGWYAARSERFWSAVDRALPVALLVVVTLGIALTIARLNTPAVRADETLLTLYRIARVLYAWSVMLAALGLARRWLNRPGRTLAYLTEAVFPYYILHQTIIVAAGFWLAPYGLPALIEASLIALVTVGGCAALHEIVIRRSPVLRPLFGLKPMPRRRRLAVGLS